MTLSHRFLFLLAMVVSAQANAVLPDFTQLVDDVSPAVVNISATKSAQSALQDGSGIDPDDMPELFRRYFGQPGMPQMPRDSTSMGTGFIISADGYVLTNHHVVDGADEVFVRLSDRRELVATVIGSDESSDVALLKIKATNLTALQLGETKTLKRGQWVVAIGSPFGFEQSVTAGIVSAVGRTSQMTGQQYVPFIQTDVAINRGNSGGPLLNTDGRVVGINSQIFSNTGGFMGVSFAIPIEVAMNAVDQLKAKGFVARGLLGVNIQEVSRDDAQALGLSRPGGALVTGFSEDSAGQKAGLKRGDVILAFDGTEIARSGELPPLVGATAPGTRVTVKVFRDGAELDVPVTIGELERAPSLASTKRADSAEVAGNPLGLVAENLTDEQREALELPADEGVVITRILGSAGQRAGLRAGDVVLMAARKPVGSVEVFNSALKDVKPGQPVMLLVRRGEVSQFVTVTAPEKVG
ncbi:MAG: Do family serine endopeptidase [Pseudomarimonas sp.]